MDTAIEDNSLGKNNMINDKTPRKKDIKDSKRGTKDSKKHDKDITKGKSSIVYTAEQICAKCVDDNEVMYDENEDFMKKLHALDIECPDELNQEVLKNLKTCTYVLLMFIKQRIIMNEKRVRFHPQYDVYGLREKISNSKLTKETQTFLQCISEFGYNVMRDMGMLETLVELDSERPGNIVAFGKELTMLAKPDILFLDSGSVNRITDKINEASELSGSHSSSDNSSESDTDNKQRKVCNKKSIHMKQKDRKSVIHNQAKTTSLKPTSFKTIENGELVDLAKNKTETGELENGEQVDLAKNENKEGELVDIEVGTNRAVLSVEVTARNNLSVPGLYKQLLLSHLHDLSKFYFLVLHVGPLVDKQQLVLYEYTPGQTITDLIQTYNGAMKAEAQDICGPEKDEVVNAANHRAKEETSIDLKKEAGNIVNPNNQLSNQYQLLYGKIGNDFIINNDFIIGTTVYKSSSLKAPDLAEPIVRYNYLDVNNLEKCFREVKGSRLQQAAHIKHYFKYLVFDCPGVKDNLQDKKDRYERYMAKREKKKQLKKIPRKQRESYEY